MFCLFLLHFPGRSLIVSQPQIHTMTLNIPIAGYTCWVKLCRIPDLAQRCWPKGCAILVDCIYNRSFEDRTPNKRFQPTVAGLTLRKHISHWLIWHRWWYCNIEVCMVGIFKRESESEWEKGRNKDRDRDGCSITAGLLYLHCKHTGDYHSIALKYRYITLHIAFPINSSINEMLGQFVSEGRQQGVIDVSVLLTE